MAVETMLRKLDIDINPEPNGTDSKPTTTIPSKPDVTLHPETLQAIGELFADAGGKGGGWMSK